jgi:hypothetical protein
MNGNSLPGILQDILYVKHLEACERIAFFVLRREFIKDFKN